MDHRLTFLSSPPVTMTPLDLRPILRQLTADWCALNSCGKGWIGTGDGRASGWRSSSLARWQGAERRVAARDAAATSAGADLQAVRAVHHGAGGPSTDTQRASTSARGPRAAQSERADI